MGVNVIFNETDYEISIRKQETWDRYNKVIQWGRKHPVRFMEQFLGLEFTDHQKYILLSTWRASFAVWVMSRSSGKSFLSAPYLMTRSMLIPNHNSYILNVTGNQSHETFSKIEDLAMGQIASVTGTTKVFLSELVKNNATDSGFTHEHASHSCQLYNGSSINTLNSVAKNIVGIRSNLNWYDEAGKIEKEFYALTKPFAVQNTDFITGKGVNGKCYPKQFPNQIILSSSAEDIFTELFAMYKQGAYEMIMGNPQWFVCDIDCRFSLAPKMKGKPYTPMVKQAVIDEAVAQNEFRANREYFNKFDVTGGQDALTNLSIILKNSQGYAPVFENIEGKQYLIAYDPSSKLDNSIVLIAEIFQDEEKGWMLKLVNCINLIEKNKGGTKKIIQKPEQLERIKQLILDYNGKELDYNNIERFIMDAGSGGGGFDMSQYLLPNWKGKEDRKEHLGLIDKKDKYSRQVMDRFPAAVDKLTLANFTKDKVVMYENTQDAISQGLVIFPKSLNSRQEMEFEKFDENGEKEYYFSKMTKKEVEALTEIEILKYEIMAIQKNKNSQTGRVSFDTIPSKKAEGMHDDRADCLAMLCNFLMIKRREEKLNESKGTTADFSKLREGKLGGGRIITPFSNYNNPFGDRGKNPFFR